MTHMSAVLRCSRGTARGWEIVVDALKFFPYFLEIVVFFLAQICLAIDFFVSHIPHRLIISNTHAHEISDAAYDDDITKKIGDNYIGPDLMNLRDNVMLHLYIEKELFFQLVDKRSVQN